MWNGNGRAQLRGPQVVQDLLGGVLEAGRRLVGSALGLPPRVVGGPGRRPRSTSTTAALLSSDAAGPGPLRGGTQRRAKPRAWSPGATPKAPGAVDHRRTVGGRDGQHAWSSARPATPRRRCTQANGPLRKAKATVGTLSPAIQ
jgi:hypothetical protein